MAISMPAAQVRIARQIVDAETALNEALIRQSELFTTLVSVRSEVEVGKFTGQDALMRLTKSQQSLLTAGNDLARVHGRLSGIAQETGQFADPCPDDWTAVGFSDDSVAA